MARTSSVEGAIDLNTTLADDDAFEISCRRSRDQRKMEPIAVAVSL